ITPEPDDYDKAVDVLIDRINRRHPRGLAKVLASFRKQYYQNAARIVLTKKQYPACQAGFMLAHISPSGEVWACCTEARSFGNLRHHDYDWNKIYFESPKRDEIRGRIRRKECACPLANAGYVNILFHPRSLARVALDYVRGS